MARIYPTVIKRPKALKYQAAMFRLLVIDESSLKLFTMRNTLKEHNIIGMKRFYVRNNHKLTMKTASVRHSLAITHPAKLQKCSNT